MRRQCGPILRQRVVYRVTAAVGLDCYRGPWLRLMTRGPYQVRGTVFDDVRALVAEDLERRVGADLEGVSVIVEGSEWPTRKRSIRGPAVVVEVGNVRRPLAPVA